MNQPLQKKKVFKKMHKQKCFYKYVKEDVALLILQNSSLLATCPYNFNDPFDVQTGLHYDFSFEEFKQGFFNKYIELVESKTAPYFFDENGVSFSIKTLWMAKKKYGFDNLYNLKGGILAWADQIDPSIPKY